MMLIKLIVKFISQSIGFQGEQEQLKYLPQSVKLEESVNPHMIRITMIVISCAVFVFLIWSSFASIKEVTRAEGEVVPLDHTQVVQHLNGGIVTEILVSEGDLVESGQILIRIDDGQARQELVEVQSRLKSVLMQKEKLEAFLNARSPQFKSLIEESNEYFLMQERAYSSYLQSMEQERVVLASQIQQKRDELERLSYRRQGLEKSLELSTEALSLQKGMHKKGYASRLTLIQYQKDSQKIQGDLNETKEEYKKSNNILSEYIERLSSLSANQKEQAFNDLDQVKISLGQVNESVSKLKDRVERLDIRSPVYGLVKGLNVNTIGSVIGPGVTLMEVVPLDSKLVVDARISTHDIGHIRLGQNIRVKVSSYDFSRYGTIEGTLDFLSATTFLDEHKNPYYRARIGLSKYYVGNNPEHNIVMPGMTVTNEIITGEKTLLEYLLKPIHLSMKSAFSER